MQRKEEKPDVIDAPAGSVMCKVCDDFANGVHFGVTSCEGCKKFFRRGLTEYQNYTCKEGRNCPITPRTRNQCRYCRYMACIQAGMSREAIKVGRPPSKKENTRHHPYSHINLSTSHHEMNPKLYMNGNEYMKQETPWGQGESPSLASLPALIHGGGMSGFAKPQPQQVGMFNSKLDREMSNDLNSSCNSTDIEMLLSCLGPNDPPLPSHFDLEEALVQIDEPQPPNLMARKQSKLQRIENLPCKPQHLNYSQTTGIAPGPGKVNFQLQPIKMEHNSYRDPVQTYSHPSPPYEAPYDTYKNPPAMYQQKYHHANQHSHGSPYNQAMAIHGSPANTLAQQNSVINQTTNGYITPITTQNSPLQQTAAYDMSTGNQMNMNGESRAYHSPGHITQAFSQPSPNAAPYGEMHTPRQPCKMIPQPPPLQQQMLQQHQTIQPHDSPYAQHSPYSISSCASSPQSGYTTDLQDFPDEFSIYEVDICQVNHKYMPSCSQEPITFNEQARTVEDIWSKNTKKSSEQKEDESHKEMETSDGGQGMFKHMKSIDDKVNQNYWSEHEVPAEADYDEDRQADMDRLMRGWLKTKEYVSSNLKTSSSSGEEGKESLWPNVKENAPLQLKLMDFIKNRLLRETQAQARFYQEIKGSDALPEKDKKTLVSTASFSNCLLMHVLYWWDEEREQCKYFWAWRIPEKDPFYVFRQTVLKFSRAIKDLNFDEKEIMMVSALTLFSTDILRIEQKDVIEKERKPLIELCAAYMKDKYKGSYVKRFHQMLSMIPALRYLSIWHNDLMAFAKTFGPIIDRSKVKTSSTTKDYEHSVAMIRQLQIQ
ncbi:uncharacterized protein [Watersipora subatra]|uniref:uncharacterized protein n=1 Tax=Watersipora subatra TaxID=2589382 RepID=UPI00355BD33E